ncbi:uncharacterized protein LOC100904808 [Galendromus occidentalis]|uniref:Uncharacterized protein LOC100904808 n=1 Tax=Galendromus occidentalis TaxID=34638 RepID=A0AAJ7WIR1_9ACAR|nr:uncharacterized protein LOC100904808 [Galendromus occidentalis]
MPKDEDSQRERKPQVYYFVLNPDRKLEDCLQVLSQMQRDGLGARWFSVGTISEPKICNDYQYSAAEEYEGFIQLNKCFKDTHPFIQQIALYLCNYIVAFNEDPELFNIPDGCELAILRLIFFQGMKIEPLAHLVPDSLMPRVRRSPIEDSMKYRDLKNFAQERLDKLALTCPVYDWEETDDIVKINAVYPQCEWRLESPATDLAIRQDWMHWYSCDPSTKNYVEIFFERLQPGVAVVWVKLQVDGRLLLLREKVYNDNSDGHSYHAGGIRLECTAPMRLWRLAINTMMEDVSSGAEERKVHVRFGSRMSALGHTLELPKENSASFLARKFSAEGNIGLIQTEISKCCARSQAILQPFTLFAEVIVGGDRQELVLFGSRVKFFGDSRFLQNVRHNVLYADNGTVVAAMELTGSKKLYGYCFDPSFYTQPIRKGRVFFNEQSVICRGSVKSLCMNFGEKKQNFNLELNTAMPISTINRSKVDAWLVEEVHGQLVKNRETFGVQGTSFILRGDYKLPESKLFLCALSRYPADDSCKIVSTLQPESKNAKLTGGKGSSLAVLTSLAAHHETLAGTMLDTFGHDWQSMSFAVRSSAVCEDSEEMSAAGQMSTFLGIRGIDQLSAAVVKCWASQFALTAVNYKRQYGQELDSPMAVVVQEMVSAECAGVMFTCDPVTSDPSRTLITANYGLGESVVSAAADPDTFLLKGRGKGDMELLERRLGRKERMIVESGTTDGTEEREVGAESASTFCLSDLDVVRLAKIGAQLSDIADSPRDFEWAIKDQKIFFLQSRPVTSFLRETDYEIRHDLNSAFFTNREIFTRANVDEVMPGALTPLSVSVICHQIFGTYCRTELMKSKMFEADRSQYPTFQTLCVGKKQYTDISKSVFSSKKSFLEGASLIMFGYDISEDEAFERGIMHDSTTSTSMKSLRYMFDAFRKVKKIVASAQKYVDEMQIDLPADADSLAMFCHVIKQLPKLQECFVALVFCSLPSAFYSIVILNLLKKSQGEKKNTPEIMVLLSNLLKSEHEIESALIPREITELANAICEDPEMEDFSKLDSASALIRLESNGGRAGELFRAFREKHAHRCYKEFDLHSKTWDIDPLPLIHTVKLQVELGRQEIEAGKLLSLEELPKQPGFLMKKLLRFFVTRAHYQVYAREAAKSAMIKGFHKFRLALRGVGRQLHSEGRVMDPELIFFLTCDEIFRLISDRDPNLMARAIRRQKMHPQLDKERFPVLFYGMPKPLDSAPAKINPDHQSMKGTPVSQGVVTGPARVVQDFLTEAHLIQRGDILVTRATDTGWTPYFPLLGGVVTEVGGVVSHGAVVAREYGLPAVVGVFGATDAIESGDVVVLDGDNGILMITKKN